MISMPQAVDVPLQTDKNGVIRVGGTRVPLETVIHAFQRGATPEQIVISFPVLKLADVYTVIAYYLQQRHSVDEYVRQADEEAEQIRAESAANQPDMTAIRNRLLARLEEKKVNVR